MCAVSMLVGAPRNCSRFACRHGFREGVLDSVDVPILLYCCTWIQYVALAIILSDSGKRMRGDKIPPQRMHAACRIVTRGSCCAKRLAGFNGNYESCCSLEQLVASLSTTDERGNLLAVRITRRQKSTAPKDTCTNHPVCCIVGSALGLE